MFHPEGPTFLELARQALSSTERGYDLLAPKFDHTPFRTPDPVLAAAAPHLGDAGRALDLGCGSGAVIEMLRPRCRERVVGVDISRGMLAEARRRLAASPRTRTAAGPRLELIRADALELPFSGGFDLVTCFGALGHFRRRDQRRLIREVARVLEPGGRFVFTAAPLPPPWSWRLWLVLGFDAAMVARNLLWRPPFVMYYLTFLLPRARRLLADHGFTVETRRGVFPELPRLRLVVATCQRTPRR